MRHSFVPKAQGAVLAGRILRWGIEPFEDRDSEIAVVFGEEAYRYFINTSRVSTPPADLYILFSIGDISDCLVDCNISTTVAR